MNPDTPQASPPTSDRPNQSPETGLVSKLRGFNWPQAALLLVGVVFLALVLTLGIYQALKKEAPKAPVSSVPSTASVVITGSGLTPATITIKPGTQLSWTNNDTKAHQVAADPYPKNDSIPGFDSDTTLLPGDSLAFTFETPGSYSYHDQLNPLDKTWQGTVIVQ